MNFKPKHLLRTLFFILVTLAGWVYFYDDSGMKTAILGGYRERWFLLCTLLSYVTVWSIIFSLFNIGKNGLFKIISLNLGIFFTIGAIELVAMVGLVDFRPFLSPGGAGKVFGKDKPDSRLRLAGKPNAIFEGVFYQDLTNIFGVESEPIHFHVQTDRFGLRNPPDKENPHIFLLGDSQIYAGAVPVETTVSESLQRSLNVPVMNVSEPGYGPQEELIRFEAMNFDVKDKVVIQFLFEGNDLGGSQTWRTWAEQKPESEWPWSGLAKNILASLHRPKPLNLSNRRYGFFTNQENNAEKVYFLYDGSRVAAYMNEMSVIEKMILEAKTDIESRGGIYAVVFVPSKMTVLHKYCQWPEGSDFESPDTWESPFRQALVDFCTSSDVAIQDLSGILQKVASEGQLPFFPVDTHLNAEGYKAIAFFLKPWIQNLMSEQG